MKTKEARTTGRPLTVIAASLAATVTVLLVAETLVRALGVAPLEWPAAGEVPDFEGVQVDPLIGPQLRPSWSGGWFGGFQVRADERGFRATGYPPPADASARVVFLGDSCTFGWGVDTGDTFVAQLDGIQRAKEKAKIELLNAAYPGQTAVSGVYVLRERVLPLHPDLVVLGFSANNAFRFSSVSDSERFRFFALRKALLRSRLVHILAAWLANRRVPIPHPRDRATLEQVPWSELKRSAAPPEFESALRKMVRDAREQAAKPLFLIFPRASGVSTDFAFEDIARFWQRARADRGADRTDLHGRNLTSVEASCLDHREFKHPPRALYERLDDWRPVYPDESAVRGKLRQGAQAYAQGRYVQAIRWFAEAVTIQPDSPLALYDLGVAHLMAGDKDAGLRHLVMADRFACNAFLQYQTLVWSIAEDLAVPVVDLTLYFQTRDGESLFSDPAHPNVAGHRLIAESLWPALTRYLSLPE